MYEEKISNEALGSKSNVLRQEKVKEVGKAISFANEIFEGIMSWSGREQRELIDHLGTRCERHLKGQLENAEKNQAYCKMELEHFHTPTDGPLDQKGHE